MAVEPGQMTVSSLRDLERLYNQAMGERLQGYLSLGRRAHGLVRDGSLGDETCRAAVEDLIKISQRAYRLGQELAQRRTGPKGPVCPECGTTVTSGDKFCGRCGKPVETKPASPMSCPTCTSTFEGPASYCPACGVRLGEGG